MYTRAARLAHYAVWMIATAHAPDGFGVLHMTYYDQQVEYTIAQARWDDALSTVE